MREHARLALADREPARARDAVRGRAAVLRLVRREESRADGQRRRAVRERGRRDGEQAVVVACAGLREDVLVHVAQAAKVRREEDVEQARAHKERRARDGGAAHARLHDGRVHARDRVGQRAEVREEEPVPREVRAQGAQEAQEARGDVLGRREVRREGEVVVYRAHGGGLEDRGERWWVAEAAS